MKKIIVVLLVVAAGLFLGREFRLAEKLGFVDSRESKLRVLRENAAKFNSQMPKPVDAETMGLGMDVTNDGVVYKYQMISYTKQQLLGSGFIERLTPVLLANACKEPNTLTILRNKFSVSYSYVDKTGDSVGTVVVTPNQCR